MNCEGRANQRRAGAVTDSVLRKIGFLDTTGWTHAPCLMKQRSRGHPVPTCAESSRNGIDSRCGETPFLSENKPSRRVPLVSSIISNWTRILVGAGNPVCFRFQSLNHNSESLAMQAHEARLGNYCRNLGVASFPPLFRSTVTSPAKNGLIPTATSWSVSPSKSPATTLIVKLFTGKVCTSF